MSTFFFFVLLCFVLFCFFCFVSLGPRAPGPRAPGPLFCFLCFVSLGPRAILGLRDLGLQYLESQDLGLRDLGLRDLGLRDLGFRDLGIWDRLCRPKEQRTQTTVSHQEKLHLLQVVSLVISGIVVSLVIPYSSPVFRKKIPEKVVKNTRKKSGKNPEKS